MSGTVVSNRFFATPSVRMPFSQVKPEQSKEQKRLVLVWIYLAQKVSPTARYCWQR